tara:strand:+ start:7195 stop:7665 length:471 start_codon:yes stop_codon:yes gene_type:complete
MSLADELEKLHQLRQKGVLSAAEYEESKQNLLRSQKSVSSRIDEVVEDVSKDTTKWCIVMHLSLLLIVVGWAIPIIMWQLKRQESRLVDEHGRNILNWMFSALIYSGVALITAPIFVGVLLGAVLFIASITFPVIGAYKAKQGIILTYPVTLKFFK